MKEEIEVYNIINKSFELREPEEVTLESIKGELTLRIRYLLDKNLEHLVSLIYRIDLNQKMVDEIFSTGSKEDIALSLADAIIERQLLKVRTRNLYKNRSKEIE